MLDFIRDQNTNPEEDANKALDALVADILDHTATEPDPHHVLEYLSAHNSEWRSRNHGTSFVFFPCTTCFIHKVPEPEGSELRHTIITNLLDRLYTFLSEKEISFAEVRYNFFHQGVAGFNNGELYLWLHNVTVNDEIACEIMMKMRKSLKTNPIILTLFRKQYEMKFYGQGFRQL